MIVASLLLLDTTFVEVKIADGNFAVSLRNRGGTTSAFDAAPPPELAVRGV